MMPIMSRPRERTIGLRGAPPPRGCGLVFHLIIKQGTTFHSSLRPTMHATALSFVNNRKEKKGGEAIRQRQACWLLLQNWSWTLRQTLLCASHGLCGLHEQERHAGHLPTPATGKTKPLCHSPVHRTRF